MELVTTLDGPGASSRKTRIETGSGVQGQSRQARPGASSRKTRIETEELPEAQVPESVSGREFQKNKD